MLYRAIIGYPSEERRLENCGLSVCDEGARLFQDNRMVAELQKPRLMLATVSGLILSGFQETGLDERGVKQYRYQEWSLRYPKPTQLDMLE